MAYETIPIEAKDAISTHVLVGVITDVDTDAGTVCLDIDDQGSFADVPVFYHCSESETADGMPFIKEERVIVVKFGTTMKVVGYEDGLLRMCCFFKELWDIFDTAVWTEYIVDVASSLIIDGELKMIATGNTSYVHVRHAFTKEWPSEYTLSFKFRMMPGSFSFTLIARTGVHWIAVTFLLPDGIHIMVEGYIDDYIYNYGGQDIDWRIIVDGNFFDFYRDDVLIAAGLRMRDKPYSHPYINLYAAGPNSVVYVDHLTIC